MRCSTLRSLTKNIDIEILRAIAVGLTLFAHLEILFYWQSAYFRKITDVFFFWGGVDIFFCISGFVITASLLREHPHVPAFSRMAIPFWIRRFWRLTPSAVFWLLFVLALSISPINDGHLKSPLQNIADLASASLYVANFHFWSCYAGLSENCGINQVYWSLSLEEQCYLILPILIYALGWRRLAAAMVVVIAAQAFLPRPILSFPWFIRTDALAAGVLIALAANKGMLGRIEPKILANRFLGFMFTAACIAATGLLAAHATKIPLHTTGIMIVSAVLVWVASYGRSYLGLSGIPAKVATYFGSRSYALYLTHVPVYYVAKPIAQSIGLAPQDSLAACSIYLLFAIGLALLLAEGNYRFIELPLRDRGRLIADRWARRASDTRDLDAHSRQEA
ncbi:hypothetical protein A7X88_02950 [Stenotrophomonas maltophilia]|nr:hypothetical protein A7X88_02950 [Stenotrophomonas maltophilia]